VTLIEHLSYVSGIDTHHFARHHTLIPAYRAVASHLHDHKHGEPSDLGLLSAHAPRLMRNDLQLCYECIKEDIDFLGFTFWRRSHQLPGIDWCQKHATALRSVNKEVGFFLQPRDAIKEATCCQENQDLVESNSVIKRYVELMHMVLDLPRPIPPSVISPRLAEKAKKFNLRKSPLGNRQLLSDLAIDQLPRSWVMKHFIKLLNKEPNQFMYEYDGVCNAGGKAHASVSYILATAILCKSFDEGHQLWRDGINTEMIKVDKVPAPVQFSHRRIKTAYVTSGGNIKQMSELMECNYRSLQEKMKKLGLPSLAAMSIPTLRAVQDCRRRFKTDHLCRLNFDQAI